VTCKFCGHTSITIVPGQPIDLHVNPIGELGICAKCRGTMIRKLCPPLYLATDRNRLPKEQLAQVLAWKPGPRGMILHGASGKCKTRCAWELIKQVWEPGVEIFDCAAFGHIMARKYRVDEAEDWLEQLGTRSPIVFFDDLGKMKFTERVESELFGVIERRCANQLPIIATLNASGGELQAMMTDDRGPSLLRRLHEFCEEVKF
jgi:DNA replication protein DnaC